MRRRQREWGSLLEDPDAWMMVQRLIGMNELAIRLLRDSGDPNAVMVAQSLEKIVPWFFEQGGQDEH